MNPGENDSLSGKICSFCIDKIQESCRMKTLFLESVEVMSLCLKEKDQFKVFESEEALESYKNLEISGSYEKFEEIVVKELIEEHEIPEKNKGVPEAPIKTRRPERCFLCNVDFETTAEDHFENRHNLIETARCTKCEFETEFPWFLNLHYQVHEDDFKLCPHCGKKFESGPGMAERFSAHKHWCANRDAWKGRRYKCQYCEADFNSYSKRTDHTRIVHTKEKPYKCSECSEQFPTKISLRRHLLKHGIGAKCFCPKCGKGYLQNYEMVRHQKNCR